MFFDQIREDRLTDAAPESEKRAMARVFTFLGPGHADAVHRRYRPVDEADDLADLQPVGRARQQISPLHSPPARDVTASLQLAQYRLQKLDRYMLPLGDLVGLQRHRTLVLRQGVDRAEGVVALCRNGHRNGSSWCERPRFLSPGTQPT